MRGGPSFRARWLCREEVQVTDEIRRAAKGVALVWRVARRDGSDQAITEELRSNLDRLVSAFERRAGGHLEDLAIHRAAEYLGERLEER